MSALPSLSFDLPSLARAYAGGCWPVTLEDGSEVKGFLCEGYATRDAVDISSFGGWRAYVGSLQAESEFSGSESP